MSSNPLSGRPCLTCPFQVASRFSPLRSSPPSLDLCRRRRGSTNEEPAFSLRRRGRGENPRTSARIGLRCRLSWPALLFPILIRTSRTRYGPSNVFAFARLPLRDSGIFRRPATWHDWCCREFGVWGLSLLFLSQVVQPPNDSVSSLSFSPKANFLVATSWDNQVFVSFVSFCVFFYP